MSEIQSAVGSPDKLASLAYIITTSTEFDYFDSEKAAIAHAKAEGIDVERLSETASGDYTKVPRLYSPNTEDDLQDAFELLAADEPQTFLHVDRYGITLGQTANVDNDDNKLELLVPPHQRSCAVRLASCDFVRFSLTPPQDLSKPMKTGSAQPLELRLGKNVLARESDPQDRARAVRNSLREWERVLVVGSGAVESYTVASLNAYSGLAGGSGDTAQMAQRMSFGIGAVGTKVEESQPVA